MKIWKAYLIDLLKIVDIFDISRWFDDKNSNIMLSNCEYVKKTFFSFWFIRM